MQLSRGEKIFQVINYIILVILSMLFFIPFLSVVSTSLISMREYVTRGQFILLPHKPTLGAYRMLLGSGSIIRNAFLVTLWRVFVGTGLNLLFTFPLAYVLSKQRLVGRIPLTMFVFFTMLFSGGLIPHFVLVEKLHLLDSLWALVLPGLINPWWMLIMRNFLMGIPEELEEAAIMDGASAPAILARIVFPLSLPSVFTIGLFYAVGHWNAWFDAVIYINDRMKLPLQPILRSILEIGTGDYSDHSGFSLELELTQPPPAEVLKAALIVVVTVPILVVYPFIQQYFIKGALVGSIKG